MGDAGRVLCALVPSLLANIAASPLGSEGLSDFVG
jgi:hypothetical protein